MSEGSLKPATSADSMDRLSLSHKTKPFSRMPIEDICNYFDTISRTRSEDPTDKRIRTYNFSLVKIKVESAQTLVSIKQTLNTNTRITG